MKRFLRNIVIYTFIVFVGAVPIDYYFTKVYFKDWANVSKYEKDFWVVSQKNKKYNVGVFGTSRAYHSVNPMVLTKPDKPTQWINLASDGTSHGDHYLQLLECINNGVKFDTILLQVDEFTLSGSEDNTTPLKEHVYALRFWRNEYREVYKDYTELYKYLFWHIPVVRYMEYNNYYEFSNSSFLKDRFQGSNGFVEMKSDSFNVNFKKDSILCSVLDTDVKYLKKFIELGQENNIELVLFTSPILSDFYKFERGRKRCMETIESIAKEYNIKHIDNSTIIELDSKEFFADYTHLNKKGADIYTTLLTKDLYEE